MIPLMLCSLSRRAGPLALLSLLFLGACDPQAARERDILRAELEATRAQLEATRAQLAAARIELQTAHAEPIVHPPALVDPHPIPPPPAPPAPPPPALIDDPAAIRCAAPGTCTVARAAYQAYLEDIDQLTRAARVVPHLVDGVQVGVKLFGIRPTSPFGRIGLKNGDLITALGEVSLAGGLEALLRAYPTLRAVDRLTFQGQRLGAPFTLQLTITP